MNHVTLHQERCDDCLFRRLSIGFVSNDDFNKLIKKSVYLKFEKGDTILKQGAVSTHLLFLHHGTVKFNYQDEQAKNLIMTVVSAPKLLGGANMFYRNTNIFSICALEDCDVCMIDIHEFKQLLLSNPKYAMALFEKSMEMFEVSIFNFISLAHKNVNGRIADILIYLSDAVYKSMDFTLNLTRKELAEFAGCSVENVINTLSRMNKDGILELEGKHLKITDRKKLTLISKAG
jgi:CRP-like cAMP-binding protein